MRNVLVVVAALGGAVGCSSSPAHALGDAGQTTAHDAGRDAPRAPPADADRHDALEAAATHDAAPRDASIHEAGARANGVIGPWQTLAPMPHPRANHCAVAASGYLVVIGGNYEPEGGSSFVDLDAVDVAPIEADGSLGAWSQAGTTPSPISGCTAVASGGTVYLLDGIYDDMSDEGHSFSADLSSSGTLGAWTPLGALPNGQDAFSSGAWIASDPSSTLLLVDSNEAATLVLTAPTTPAFGGWSQENWLSGFLGRPEYAFTGSFLYAIGGYLSDDAGNPAVATVEGASVGDGGAIGTPFTTSSLPLPATFGEAVAADDWVFVVGGKPAIFSAGQANTWSAEVLAGGQLATWIQRSILPEGRTDMALTLAGDFIYLTGGGFTGPGLDTVFAARVRF